MSEFNKEIKRRREERGFTLVEFARKVMCRPVLLKKLEEGKVENIDVILAYDIARELGFIEGETSEFVTNAQFFLMLKTTRLNKNMSLKDLCSKFEWSMTKIIKYESSMIEQISIDMLLKWLELLELDYITFS